MPHPPHKGTMPVGMSTEMTGDVKPMGSPAPGLYRLMGDISMPGTWKLDLTATVPGEPDAITGPGSRSPDSHRGTRSLER